MEKEKTISKYTLMLDMLSDMVMNYAHQYPSEQRNTNLPLSHWKNIFRQMQKEDDEWSDFELTAELLNTRDFAIVS